MKDAECAESKENLIFLFIFFRVMGHFLVNFVTSSSQFSMNFHDNSKNKNRKFFYFVFHSIQHMAHHP